MTKQQALKVTIPGDLLKAMKASQELANDAEVAEHLNRLVRVAFEKGIPEYDENTHYDYSLNSAKPYEIDEMVFDGNMDRDRLRATLNRKYQEDQEKLKKQDGAK